MPTRTRNSLITNKLQKRALNPRKYTLLLRTIKINLLIKVLVNKPTY